MAKWLEDNRLELTAIRSELAAAKEQRWQLESLIVDAHFRAFGARHYAYVDPKSACDLLVADIAATQHEREKAEAENAALKAHVERLRGAFKRIMTTDENGNSMNWPEIDEMVRPLLAATPAQSLAACKAEALSAMAQKLTAMNDHPIVLHVAHIVQEDADKLQAEAANGPK